ncbi:MAG: heme-binding protein [Rubrobacter sp.]|nr:heme-binding protein [Rubrobacter sp.]
MKALAGHCYGKQIGSPSNVAVVDAGGNLVAHARMDGAWIGSIDISINKAFTPARSTSPLRTCPIMLNRASSSSASTSPAKGG